jgi:isoleucyl-tRNA synthetase
MKVRQPLAELRIQPADDTQRRAVERLHEQLVEELNLKRVVLHEPSANGPLLTFEYKLNPKSAGPKFGPKLGQVQAALGRATPALLEGLQAGKAVTLTLADGSSATVEPGDVWMLPKTEKGFAGLAERGTQLLLDARITPELAREGMAREAVRNVQDARKKAELQMEDRIVLYLGSEDAELSAAIVAHRDYIGNETLVRTWSEQPLSAGAYRAQVKIDGRALTIELRCAPS